jgi:hypothetical protein
MNDARDLDREAAIIVNDLDSMAHRIEMLQAHPRYTDALSAVIKAKLAIGDGRSEIHQQALRHHYPSETR